MLSRLSLVIPTWRSNEMTQQEESHFVQDTTVTILAQNIKQDSGHVSFGKKASLSQI